MILTISSAHAGGPPNAWHVMFQIAPNGEQVYIGGADGGSGQQIRTSIGQIHIGLAESGQGSGGLTVSGIYTPISQQIYIWADPGVPGHFDLDFWTTGWDNLWLSNREEVWPNSVILSANIRRLGTEWSQSIPIIPTQRGSINLLTLVGEWNGCYVMDFTATPVPEPGSLLALGFGLIGMAGFIRRR